MTVMEIVSDVLHEGALGFPMVSIGMEVLERLERMG